MGERRCASLSIIGCSVQTHGSDVMKSKCLSLLMVEWLCDLATSIFFVCVCVVLYICTHQTSKCKSITEGQRWAVKVTAHPPRESVCVLAFSNRCHCEFLQTSSRNEPSFVCFLSSLSSPSHHHPGSHLLF